MNDIFGVYRPLACLCSHEIVHHYQVHDAQGVRFIDEAPKVRYTGDRRGRDGVCGSSRVVRGCGGVRRYACDVIDEGDGVSSLRAVLIPVLNIVDVIPMM